MRTEAASAGLGGRAGRRAEIAARTDRPLLAGVAALAAFALFLGLRVAVAAGGNVTRLVRAAEPYSDRFLVPRGLFVFGGNGYDGQFYYRLALDPADLRRTAFGITMDAPFRLERIGYPALAWLVALGRHSWVPAALVVVNLAALTAVGLAGGALARDSGRHALWGLLLAGYFGFFFSLGNDLTEPVAAACLLGGVLAWRRGRHVAAGLLFGYAVLTRETVLVVPLTIGVLRLAQLARGRAQPAPADFAWLAPLAAFAAWQLVLRAATAEFILANGVGSNSGSWPPFGAFAGALRMNAGLLWPPTGAAYIWFAEVGTLVVFLGAALLGLRPAWEAQAARGAVIGARYERAALVAFVVVEFGFLSASIWDGHADLRSVDECYLFAVLVLLGSRRRLRLLALCAAAVALVAAVHQGLYLS